MFQLLVLVTVLLFAVEESSFKNAALLLLLKEKVEKISGMHVLTDHLLQLI